MSQPTGLRENSPAITNDPPFTTPKDVHDSLVSKAQMKATRELHGPAGAVVVNIGDEDEQYWLGRGYMAPDDWKAKTAKEAKASTPTPPKTPATATATATPAPAPVAG